jgi:hypothetical protein
MRGMGQRDTMGLPEPQQCAVGSSFLGTAAGAAPLPYGAQDQQGQRRFEAALCRSTTLLGLTVVSERRQCEAAAELCSALACWPEG